MSLQEEWVVIILVDELVHLVVTNWFLKSQEKDKYQKKKQNGKNKKQKQKKEEEEAATLSEWRREVQGKREKLKAPMGKTWGFCERFFW